MCEDHGRPFVVFVVIFFFFVFFFFVFVFFFFCVVFFVLAACTFMGPVDAVKLAQV